MLGLCSAGIGGARVVGAGLGSKTLGWAGLKDAGLGNAELGGSRLWMRRRNQRLKRWDAARARLGGGGALEGVVDS